MEFEATYLQNVSVVSSRSEDNQRQWLKNNIVWEPVDGQHIIVACQLAKVQEQVGLILEEEFRTRFAKRKAKFIVFNNPNLYIEASIRINAKEFEKKFYSTMYEDMVKLHEIQVACEKLDPDVRADDAKKADAITQTTSALYWTVSLAGKSTSLGALAKLMLQYMQHAW